VAPPPDEEQDVEQDEKQERYASPDVEHCYA
jgi:hypothetical protein